MFGFGNPAQGALSLPDLSDLRNWQVGFRDAFSQGVFAVGDPRDGETAGKAEIAHLRDKISAKNEEIAGLSAEIYAAREAMEAEGGRN